MKKLFKHSIFDDLVYEPNIEYLEDFISHLELALEYIQDFKETEDDYKTILDIIERTGELKEKVEEEEARQFEEDER